MARPETCCPECGHSPVGDENCDHCGAIFGRVRQTFQPRTNTALLSAYDELDDEKTDFSQQIPDSVSVRPLGAAATFFCAAAAFFFEANGALGIPREPELLYGLAGLDAAIAVGILLRLGLFRALAYLTVPLHIAVLIWAARDNPFSPMAILGIVFPIATLVGTVLEPGPARRVAGLALCILLLGGRAWFVVQSPTQDSLTRRLGSLSELGVRVALPPELAFIDGVSKRKPLIPLPPPSDRSAAVGITSPTGELRGFVWAEKVRAERKLETQLSELAAKLLGELDAHSEDGQLEFAPGEFAGTAHVSVLFRREAGSNDQKGMLIVAAAPDGPLVGAAVVASSASDTLLRLNAAKVFTSVRMKREDAAPPSSETESEPLAAEQ